MSEEKVKSAMHEAFQILPIQATTAWGVQYRKMIYKIPAGH
jgi:hypothetical protein